MFAAGHVAESYRMEVSMTPSDSHVIAGSEDGEAHPACNTIWQNFFGQNCILLGIEHSKRSLTYVEDHDTCPNHR